MSRAVATTGCLLAVFACAVASFAAYMNLKKTEHGIQIQQVIIACTEFVEANGKWPADWPTLEAIDNEVNWRVARTVCTIDFFLSCADVAAQTPEDFKAIFPRVYSFKPTSSIEALIRACDRAAAQSKPSTGSIPRSDRGGNHVESVRPAVLDHPMSQFGVLGGERAAVGIAKADVVSTALLRALGERQADRVCLAEVVSISILAPLK